MHMKFIILVELIDLHCFVTKAFREAIKLAVRYKENSTDFMDEVLRELEVHYNIIASLNN